VSESGKSGYVPDLTVSLDEVVGVERMTVKPATGPSAKVVVATQAIDGHHLVLKVGARTKGRALPLTAARAPHQAQRYPVLLLFRKSPGFLGSGAVAAFCEVSKQIRLGVPGEVPQFVSACCPVGGDDEFPEKPELAKGDDATARGFIRADRVTILVEVMARVIIQNQAGG
jgi:hypothetical protein